MMRAAGSETGVDGVGADLSIALTARLTVVLGPMELAGSAVSFLRADLERADRHAGSPAEIWRTAELDRAASAGGAPGLAEDRWQWRITPRLEQSLPAR